MHCFTYQVNHKILCKSKDENLVATGKIFNIFNLAFSIHRTFKWDDISVTIYTPTLSKIGNRNCEDYNQTCIVIYVRRFASHAKQEFTM